MAFIDEVKIRVHSGAGGNGCISFRREKYIPLGGPNGGNGGHGGNVYMVGTRDKTSLLDFKFKPKYEAKRGQHGKGSDMDGRAGEDLYLSVPLGTIIYDAETGEEIHDLCEENKPLLIARGGRGGRGNKSFVSSVLRAPRVSTPGALGEEKELKLELRLIADVGLVGLPNAGKSTLLKTLSRATPKVASYPFTTLQPNLGVVYHKDQSFVMADLPGLIEGASEGQGLGIQFLRHASRNKLLLHLVEISDDNEVIKKNIQTIRKELKAYDEKLLKREELIVFTKADTLSPEDFETKKKELKKLYKKSFFISSQSKEGIQELLDFLIKKFHG